jgi:ferredoxin-NADP reductase
MSFRFSKKEKQKQQQGRESDDRQSSFFEYTAGQYAFFDIGGVYNDSKGPIRHFTISSSPTEDFVMITTRIRDTPYKKRLASLKEGTIVKEVLKENLFYMRIIQSLLCFFPVALV